MMNSIGTYSIVVLLTYVVVLGFAVVLGVLLVRTLLWVIRALQSSVRERELRMDLLLATGDDPTDPADPAKPADPVK